MEQRLRRFSFGEVIPQDALIPHFGTFFSLYPAEKWFPALWELSQAYSVPRFQSRDEMVCDEKMQVFIQAMDLLVDLYRTWSESLSDEDQEALQNISPGDRAA
jgi:hypothetical protein